MSDMERSEGFEKHAAPEAIQSHIDRLHGQKRQLESVLTWLESLRDERTRQIAEGSWPAKGSGDTPEETTR